MSQSAGSRLIATCEKGIKGPNNASNIIIINREHCSIVYKEPILWYRSSVQLFPPTTCTLLTISRYR